MDRNSMRTDSHDTGAQQLPDRISKTADSDYMTDGWPRPGNFLAVGGAMLHG